MTSERRRSALRAARWTRENALLLVAFGLAATTRLLLGPVVLGSDLENFFLPWYRATVDHGGIGSLGFDISLYAPPYMILLALASYLPLSPTAAIKLIPFVFDFIAAVGVFRLARLFHPRGVVPLVVACVFLYCPTVLLNGAAWGQCDVTYATFLVFSLTAALQRRPLASALFFSVACGFKMQAAFFFPAIAMAFLAQGYSLVYFALTPAFYLVSAIPALLLGRPLANVLGIYPRQFAEAGALTMNAASIYQWLPETSAPGAFARCGLAFAAGACALSAYLILRLSRRPRRSGTLLNVALFFSALSPFLLPNMHERYSFASDVLACVVPFVTPSLALPAFLLVFASLVSYGPFIGSRWMPLSYAAMLNLAALVWIARHLARDLRMADALRGDERRDPAPEEPAGEA